MGSMIDVGISVEVIKGSSREASAIASSVRRFRPRVDTEGFGSWYGGGERVWCG